MLRVSRTNTLRSRGGHPQTAAVNTRAGEPDVLPEDWAAQCPQGGTPSQIGLETQGPPSETLGVFHGN